jgi:ribose transport system permease protein
VGIALVVLFGVWTPATFLTTGTLQLVAQEQVVIGLVAVGLVVPLAAGIFDLSIGYGVGLSTIMCASLLSHGSPLIVAILVPLALGLMLGLFNSFLIVGVGIDSFIATLASGAIAFAAVLAISNNTQILFQQSTLAEIGNGKALGVPLPVFYLAVFAVLVWFFLEYTPLGRRLYAVGGGREAARLSGVKVNRIVCVSLLVSGFAGALGGIVVTGEVGTGSPDIGSQYLLGAFAAAFLGSTQINPGRFNVWGTIIAVYVLGIGTTGLNLVTSAAWAPSLFNGVALATAVGLASIGARHRRLLARRRRRRAID